MADEGKGGGQKVLLGLAIGVVLGAAAGLLFAPETGAQLRRRLLARLRDAGVDLEGLVRGGASDVEPDGQ